MAYDSTNRWSNAGKGDKPRKLDKEKFDKEYERTFGKKELWYEREDRFTKDDDDFFKELKKDEQ